MAEGAVVLGYNYFVVKTALPLLFLPEKWPSGCSVERKTVSDFVLTQRQKEKLFYILREYLIMKNIYTQEV